VRLLTSFPVRSNYSCWNMLLEYFVFANTIYFVTFKV
jgi:hypothetical protein